MTRKTAGVCRRSGSGFETRMIRAALIRSWDRGNSVRFGIYRRAPIECKDSPTVAPSGSLLPHEPDRSWAITEFTGYQSTQKIRYLSSWRTPVLLEKPCRTGKLDVPVEEYGRTSPTSSVRSVASKVNTAVAKEGVFARDWESPTLPTIIGVSY